MFVCFSPHLLTSENEVLPEALEARTRSPTTTSEISLTSPDSRETVSEPAKQDAGVRIAGACVGDKVLPSAVGVLTDATKPLEAPTLLRLMVMEGPEFARDIVVDVMLSAVDTE